MSSLIYPSLPGLGLSQYRTPIFSTRTQTSISGKETRIHDWSLPRYRYEHKYEVLRQHDGFREMETMQSFFLQVRGAGDTWLYSDDSTPDNSVTDQEIGAGDGSTTSFQLVRTFGLGLTTSWVDPVLAYNNITNVKINGSVVASNTYSVTAWGTDNPGILTFTSAPGDGLAITATFTYYIPCRFDDDSVQFEKFMDKRFLISSLKFTSVK